MTVMVVFAFGCHYGMNTVVFSTSYGQDCRAGVGMVLVSTTLSALTIPLLYALTAI